MQHSVHKLVKREIPWVVGMMANIIMFFMCLLDLFLKDVFVDTNKIYDIPMKILEIEKCCHKLSGRYDSENKCYPKETMWCTKLVCLAEEKSSAANMYKIYLVCDNEKTHFVEQIRYSKFQKLKLDFRKLCTFLSAAFFSRSASASSVGNNLHELVYDQTVQRSSVDRPERPLDVVCLQLFKWIANNTHRMNQSSVIVGPLDSISHDCKCIQMQPKLEQSDLRRRSINLWVARKTNRLTRLKRNSSSITEQTLWQPGSQFIPTYTLPVILNIPIRAILLSPSYLIPNIGFIRIYDDEIFRMYKFYVVKVDFGVFQTISDLPQGYRTENEWNSVEQFTGDQVVKQRVRYLGTRMQPEYLEVRFEDHIHITCIKSEKNTSKSIRLILPIVYERITMELNYNEKLVISVPTYETYQSGTAQLPMDRVHCINPKLLHVKVSPPETDMHIYFTLVSVPKHGHLFLKDETHRRIRDRNKRTYLGVNSQFTQQDIMDHRLFYLFKRVIDENVSSYSSSIVTDHFEFRIRVPGAQLRTIHQFTIVITYNSSLIKSLTEKSSSIQVTNKSAKVLEGTEQELNFKVHFDEETTCEQRSGMIYFKILKLPRYGTLKYRTRKSEGDLSPINSSSSYPIGLIQENVLLYVHDGSETLGDHFDFEIFCGAAALEQMVSIFTEMHNLQFLETLIIDTFQIKIIPVNDNPPILEVNDIQAHFNSTVLLPTDWLTVQDIDKPGSATDPIDYKITWHPTFAYDRNDFVYPEPGYFVNTYTGNRLQSFVQRDVLNGKVSFQHLGAPKCSLKIFVTDGVHVTGRTIVINITRPTFRVLTTSLRITQRNKYMPLFFEVLTNVYTAPQDLSIELIQPPCHGILVRKNSTTPIRHFTYEEILRYFIFYQPVRSPRELRLHAEVDELIQWRAFCSRSPDSKTTDKINLLLNLRSTTNAWRETFGVNVDINEFHLQIPRFKYMNTPSSGSLPQSLTMDLHQACLKERLSVGIGNKVLLEWITTKQFLDLETVRPILFQLTMKPQFGILRLSTPSFTLDSIDRFEMTDVLAKRVSYYQTDVAQLSEFRLKPVDRLVLAVDCFQVSLVAMEHSLTDKVGDNGISMIFLQTICVDILQNELPIKVHELVVHEHEQLSLTDTRLQPKLQDINEPIRHDEPFTGPFVLQAKNGQGGSLKSYLDATASFTEVYTHGQSKKANPYMVYIVRKQPDHGNVVSKRLNRTVDAFSSVDLVRRDIFYWNLEGSENKEDTLELLAVNVDGKQAAISYVNVMFTVEPNLHGIFLIRRRPMKLIYGWSVILDPACLYAEVRNEQQQSTIYYQVLATFSGFLAFVENHRSKIQRFSQQDIQDGRVLFVHKDDLRHEKCGFDFLLVIGTTERTGPHIYRFQVHKFTLHFIHSRTVAAFPLGFETISSWHLKYELRETISEPSYRTLHYPNNTIISKELCSASSRTQERTETNIIFTVARNPIGGTLLNSAACVTSTVMTRKDMKSVRKFTQGDIENGQVCYMFQSGTTLDLDATFEDQVFLNVSILGTLTVSEKMVWKQNLIDTFDMVRLNVSVSYKHITVQNQQRLVDTHPLVVEEGATGDIHLRHINAAPLRKLYQQSVEFGLSVPELNAIDFCLWRQPNHGVLRSLDGKLVEGDILPVVSSNKTKGHLSYSHDGSDTTSDVLYLQVRFSDAHITSGGIFIIFPILIKPMNDERPRLIRPLSGGTASENSPVFHMSDRIGVMDVLGGTRVLLTIDQIHIEDADTPADNLFIYVTSYPEFGHLLIADLTRKHFSLHTSMDKYELFPRCIEHCVFTQAHINRGLVYYRAKYVNSSTPVLDSFSFRVQEESIQQSSRIALSGTVLLRVVPTKFKVVVTILDILQGDQRVTLSSEHIRLSLISTLDNQVKDDVIQLQEIIFSVIQLPSHGVIYLDTVPVIQFTGSELLSGRLAYELIDNTVLTDFFILRIWSAEADVIPDRLRFSSQPFLSFVGTNITDLYTNESYNADYAHITDAQITIQIRPRLETREIRLTPGQLTPIDSTVINASRLWQFIEEKTLLDRDGESSQWKPMLTFPTAAHLRFGRFRIRNHLFVSPGYPDEPLGSAVNVTLETINANLVQFETYDLAGDENGEKYEMVPYVISVGQGIPPAEGLLKMRIAATVSEPQLTASSQTKIARKIVGEDVNEDYEDRTISISTICLGVGLSLVCLLLFGGVAVVVYKKRCQEYNEVFQSKHLRCKPHETEVNKSHSSEGNEGFPEDVSPVDINLMLTNKSTHNCQPMTKELLESVEMKNFNANINVTNLSPNDLGTKQTLLSSCNCDFNGAVLYWSPGLSDSLHVLTRTPDQNNTFTGNINYILLPDSFNDSVTSVPSKSTNLPVTGGPTRVDHMTNIYQTSDCSNQLILSTGHSFANYEATIQVHKEPSEEPINQVPINLVQLPQGSVTVAPLDTVPVWFAPST
ncbi:hypothetical protein EG68_03323 [Paragonimus skrjabini miyazakii]|uniref:Chondroitin sulfate proteoglycan 4 n=1 Tax=Paragonimus skrjabini miyazakii TaxID=59628 RepID=A0A8S9YYA3_9TREM|nr:hypothetical protein EG68_03323 [Paragonimus skrjabini miyazakii]